MKSVRLLPVVIFASLALLAFKTIGLVTTGSYVMTGTSEAVAAGGGGGGGHGAAPANGEAVDPTVPITIPPEPTLEDATPTLEDGAPTLSLQGEAAAGGHGAGAQKSAAAEGGHGASPAEPAAAGGHDEAAAAAEGTAAESAVSEAEAENAIEEALDLNAGTPAATEQAMTDSERTLLKRLADRRSELDAIQGELSTRQQLVEAAEQKLAERTAALEAIEARINAMVDQQTAVDAAQFKSLISMYENMKPADAAKIFNALEMDVLVRVAKAINPRKMAPIMAKMDPAIAQILTVKLAAVSPVTQPTTIAAADGAGDLPQIVGQ